MMNAQGMKRVSFYHVRLGGMRLLLAAVFF